MYYNIAPSKEIDRIQETSCSFFAFFFSRHFVAPNPPLDPHGASIYPCAESVRRSQHLSVRRIRVPYPWAVAAPTKKFTKSPSIKLLSPLFVKHHFCGLLFVFADSRFKEKVP